ncbi:MAG: SRPBCC family protein [Verrucomicrobia bacterium]|nr:SRPBCC family protein [Verrucomicrobiota bacterium]
MTTNGSIEIDRPIEAVFDYTVNNVPEWSDTVVEEKVIEQTPDGVGSRFHVLTRDPGGKEMPLDGTVTLNERPTAQTVVMVGKQFDIEASYTFEDLGGRTRVNLVSVVTPNGFKMKLMFLMVGWLGKRAGCKALQKELASLKEKAESRPA